MSHSIHQHRILVLNLGSQSAQLVARKVRELGVYTELWDADVEAADLSDFAPQGIILSSQDDLTELTAVPRFIFEARVPILGLGAGALALLQADSTETAVQIKAEAQSMVLGQAPNHTLNTGIPKGSLVWSFHDYQLAELPASFEPLFVRDTQAVLGFKHQNLPLSGVLFAPEMEQSEQGNQLFENFIQQCGCEKKWVPEAIIEQAIADIKAQVGKDEVILGLSGGVDSSVTALLLHRAIGDQLTCVFVDHGLLRLNEADQVMQMFGDQFGLKIRKIDAEQRFLAALAGKTDPEQKRKIIGHEFIAVFDEQSKQFADAKWLAQGTIYPDIIESLGSKKGKKNVIKSHHNVGGLPDDMAMGLVEPLKQLFKDEVRRIGLVLGLPYDMLYRHPFPGPGLGVRVLGEIKKEYCDILRQADAIFIEALYEAGIYHDISQAFAVFVPVKSVGVQQEKRNYAWVIALRAVETIDFMTARWAHLPYELLDQVSEKIITEVEGVSRVVYDISGKPPATIEWE